MRVIQFGIDRLLGDINLQRELEGRRVALLAHPASMTADFQHSLDALRGLRNVEITAAFGPQHGLRGDKQDNMVESADFRDPMHGIPVFSLYGEVRRPTEEMLDHFDVLLVDLQDVGCRIYTFITTLLYVLEAAAQHGKTVWVLDRPNPAGRPIEGLTLREGWESFVGAGPIPMRHGLTLGELGIWFVSHFRLAVDYRVIPMRGWDPDAAPGYGWPLGERSWVNPSPNAASLSMARAYAGTVMLEGTTLSEGRGTTRPLEVIGAPGLEIPEGGSVAFSWNRGSGQDKPGVAPPTNVEPSKSPKPTPSPKATPTPKPTPTAAPPSSATASPTPTTSSGEPAATTPTRTAPAKSRKPKAASTAARMNDMTTALLDEEAPADGRAHRRR